MRNENGTNFIFDNNQINSHFSEMKFSIKNQKFYIDLFYFLFISLGKIFLFLQIVALFIKEFNSI